jgi:hypothetical protein
MGTKQRVTTEDYFGIKIAPSSRMTRGQYEETLKQMKSQG